jgi:3-oxoacyl-[acyl-carrier-protein] synthase-3
MGLSDEKVLLNIQRYGNTTAATIPLCLWDYQGRFKRGDNIVLAAFGGGFTWGATWIKWAI